MSHWKQFPAVLEQLDQELRPAATALQQQTTKMGCLSSPVSYYWHVQDRCVGFYPQDASDTRSLVFAKIATAEADLDCQREPLQLTDLRDLGWIKIATSPSVRTAGESLFYLPTENGIIPPSPLAAMLASAGVGSGLGYSTATLASLASHPDRKKRRQDRWSRRGAILGGSLAVPWMLANAGRGVNPLFDNSLTEQPADGLFRPQTIPPASGFSVPVELLKEGSVLFPATAGVSWSATEQFLLEHRLPEHVVATTLGVLKSAQRLAQTAGEFVPRVQLQRFSCSLYGDSILGNQRGQELSDSLSALTGFSLEHQDRAKYATDLPAALQQLMANFLP